MSDGERGRLGAAGKAAAGLTAAAAAAYGVYLLGATRGNRTPVTELRNALGLRLDYVPWKGRHYAYYSRPGRGRPLVFLHSINATASAHEMRPLVSHFARETQRPLWALEWLGFGHSDRPDIRYTPELLEDQLEHWLGRVIRPHGGADIVALSLGASYAAEVARRRPDLITSLVALEPAGLHGTPGTIGEGWSRLLFTVPGVQRAFYDRLTSPEALRRFARNQLFSPGAEIPEDFVSFGAETARVEGAARPLDDLLDGRLFPADVLDTFTRLRQSMLLIFGIEAGGSSNAPDVYPELEERDNVRVVRVSTGALPHWERPAEVVEHISHFLEVQTAPGPA